MRLKKWVGYVHLYLGLASGIIVFILGITGCILAFEQEIKSVTQPYRYVSVPERATILPPSVLKQKAEAALPGKKCNGVLYNLPGRSVEMGFYNFEPEYYYVAYLNPYTGEVLKIWDEDEDFFHFILHGHYYLWLPEKIGQPIAASATLIFFVLLVSGMVLWWPTNKSAAKQRFSIKWTAAWRRKNYDIHNVLGFYVCIVGMVFALTGLVWGFQWFSQGLYNLTGGKGSDAYVIPPSDSTAVATFPTSVHTVDHVYANLIRKHPDHQGINLSFPIDQTSSIYSYVNYRAGTYYKVDYHYYDQKTAKEIKGAGPYSGNYADADLAGTLRRMNYDLHVGAIWGLPGKILAFFASLICASLPVTGTLIWWGRRNKKSKKRTKSATPATDSSPRRAVVSASSVTRNRTNNTL